jgi:uncharacterized membrane protein YuzA (DUF378 family)
MKSLHMIAFILLVIGGLNWGLAIFGWDLSHWHLGMTVDKIVYALVALSAIYEAATHGKRCRECNPAGAMGSSGMGMGR